MSKVIELTDEQYQAIERAAQTRGQTPDALLAQLLAQVIEELRDPHRDPRYYETDEWFRHLGASEEMIERVKREMRDEAERPYDADA